MSIKIKSLDDFNTLFDLISFFKDEMTCLKFLEQWLWNGKIRCPHCGIEEVYRYQDGKRFKCKQCKIEFTHKVGTIFESSNLPLIKWFMAIHIITSHKKGVSSCQLAREIGVTQKTAWMMGHKIRKTIEQIPTEQLEGVIEVDETFVGGKNKNRHKNKKVKNAPGRTFKDKVPVFGMKKRGGEVRTVVIKDTTKKSLRPVIREHIKEGTVLYSDDWGAYDTLYRRYKYDSIDHSKGRYREGDVCTNGIESFWSHLKRMIIGIYHYVSPKHLQKYCDEITFRYNTRNLKQGERLKLFLGQVNCTLKYKTLIKNYG